MDIRFCVKVPVLSLHKTVAAPNVSIAAARRVNTRACEIRHAPITAAFPEQASLDELRTRS
jgi:hypothetical protein